MCNSLKQRKFKFYRGCSAHPDPSCLRTRSWQRESDALYCCPYRYPGTDTTHNFFMPLQSNFPRKATALIIWRRALWRWKKTHLDSSTISPVFWADTYWQQQQHWIISKRNNLALKGKEGWEPRDAVSWVLHSFQPEHSHWSPVLLSFWHFDTSFWVFRVAHPFEQGWNYACCTTQLKLKMGFLVLIKDMAGCKRASPWC